MRERELELLEQDIIATRDKLRSRLSELGNNLRAAESWSPDET